MTAPCPAIRAPQTDADTRCATLDDIAARMPEGECRWLIEQAAAASRARSLVAADRAARESASWVRA